MYGKHFASTYTGSMMASGANVFAVWGYVIAHHCAGSVELNPRLLAAVIGSTPQEMADAIEYLCQPDPNSRSPAAAGRRLIQEGTFRYRVVNGERYRAIRHEDDRRAYDRERKRAERARAKQNVQRDVADSHGLSKMSAHTEADTEAEADTHSDQESQTANTVRPSKRKNAAAPRLVCVEDLVQAGVHQQHASDWLAVRKAKNLPLTSTAWESTQREAAKAGLSAADAVREAAAHGWAGFRASWMSEKRNAGASSPFDGVS